MNQDKNTKILLVAWAILCSVIICLFFCKYVFAGVPIKYDSKVCKMEIITNKAVENSRNVKDNIEKKVLEFCENKYIYNINLTIDKHNNYIYVIIYNDRVE